MVSFFYIASFLIQYTFSAYSYGGHGKICAVVTIVTDSSAQGGAGFAAMTAKHEGGVE